MALWNTVSAAEYNHFGPTQVDNIKRIIQLSDVICVLFTYNWDKNILLQ